MSTTKTSTVTKAKVDYILRDIFQLDKDNYLFQIIRRSKIIGVEQLPIMSYEQIKSMKCKSKDRKEELVLFSPKVSLIVALKTVVEYLYETNEDFNSNFYSI